jgi:Flp pilus assembly pilin Flp
MRDAALLIRRLATDRAGVTALEYGVIAGVLSAGIVSAMTVMRDKITAAIGVISF